MEALIFGVSTILETKLLLELSSAVIAVSNKLIQELVNEGRDIDPKAELSMPIIEVIEGLIWMALQFVYDELLILDFFLSKSIQIS